ncbi:hypothetical protein EUX98_g7678 [Antrodiella citrinella]|uniref:Uncharacterized protein n=1 Tax=Antrodiella citrinella TaxID=2447956 RepID=A0A4S4MN99_9APHY|nr:hypothetical protein EUX98_g7678 [Antrodiella citrinella]
MLQAIGLWLLQLVLRRVVPGPRSDERSSPGLTINLWLFPFFFISTHRSDPALERHDRREDSPGFIVPIPPPRSPPADRSSVEYYNRATQSSTSDSDVEISEVNSASITSQHIPQSLCSRSNSDHTASGSHHAMETRSHQRHSGHTQVESLLIPKPKGALGRPNGGGYSLRTALRWSDRSYHDVYWFVKELAKGEMKPGVSFTRQPACAFAIIKDMSADLYPFLEKYEDLWPVDDFIRSSLSTLNTAHKKFVNRNPGNETRAYTDFLHLYQG